MVTITLPHQQVLRSLGAVFLVMCAFIVMYASSAHAQAPTVAPTTCHTITNALHAVPPQYGSPLNFFNSSLQQLMSIACFGSEHASLVLGAPDSNIYVYKYGYHRVNGEWQQLTLTGDTEVGAWFVGTAQANINNPRTNGVGTVIAYMCEKVNGQWKCGCADAVCAQPKWQRQDYDTRKQDLGNLSSSDIPSMTSLGQGVADEDAEFDVYRASASYVLPGDTLTLTGAKFSTKEAGNTIYWNGTPLVRGVKSENGSTLTFPVPTLPSGGYSVTVGHGGDVTEYGAEVWISDPNQSAPSVTRIEPEVGVQGGTYTIIGSGFAPTSNSIRTTFGVINDVPSTDGTSLTFVYEPFEEHVVFRDMSGDPADYEQKVQFMVTNAGGTSEAGTFFVEM